MIERHDSQENKHKSEESSLGLMRYKLKDSDKQQNKKVETHKGAYDKGLDVAD